MNEPTLQAQPTHSILRTTNNASTDNSAKKKVHFSSEALTRRDINALINTIKKFLNSLKLKVPIKSPLFDAINKLLQLERLNNHKSFKFFHRQKTLLAVANLLWNCLDDKSKKEFKALMRAAEKKLNLPKFSLLSTQEQRSIQQSTANSTTDSYIGIAAQPSIQAMQKQYKLYRALGYQPIEAGCVAGMTYIPEQDEAKTNLGRRKKVTIKKNGKKSTAEFNTELYHLKEYYLPPETIHSQARSSIKAKLKKAEKVKQANQAQQLKQTLLKHYQEQRVKENWLKGTFFAQKSTREGQIQKLINIMSLGNQGLYTKEKVIKNLDALITKIQDEEPLLESTLQGMLEKLKNVIENRDMSNNDYSTALIQRFGLSSP